MFFRCWSLIKVHGNKVPSQLTRCPCRHINLLVVFLLTGSSRKNKTNILPNSFSPQHIYPCLYIPLQGSVSKDTASLPAPAQPTPLLHTPGFSWAELPHSRAPWQDCPGDSIHPSMLVYKKCSRPYSCNVKLTQQCLIKWGQTGRQTQY